jgi:hypothetical protein
LRRLFYRLKFLKAQILRTEEEANFVKPVVIVGVVLVLLGIVGLSYSRISYTSKETIAEIGPFKATKEKQESIPLPPVMGSLALVAGVGLIALGLKK